MRTKRVLGLAACVVAGVALSGCENCGCFGRRGATAGYDHSSAIGMNGTTTTPTAMAQGTVPTQTSRTVAGTTTTAPSDPMTRSNSLTNSTNSMSGYTSGTQASNYNLPASNVPSYTSPPTSGTRAFTSPSMGGTSSAYSSSSPGMSATGITPAGNRSLTPGSYDTANRYTVPPPSSLSGTSTPGSGSSLTPGMAPPSPVSPSTPGSGVPTLKNTDE